MTFRIRVVPEAKAQIQALTEWWRKNRPAASELVKNELGRIFALLVESPKIGSPYGRSKVPSVRRCPLRKTPYYVYYRVNDVTHEVVIMSVWSAMRRRGPSLR